MENVIEDEVFDDVDGADEELEDGLDGADTSEGEDVVEEGTDTGEDSDEFDKLFEDDEEFSVEGLELDKIEGYNDSDKDKEAIQSLGKELFDLGVKGKQIKPVIEKIGNLLKGVVDVYETPLNKDTYNKMPVDVKTNYKLMVGNAKSVLTKDEMKTFSTLFNTEEKIRLLDKLTGNKTSKTGTTDYAEGGRKPLADTMTYSAFDKRIQDIAIKYMKTPEIEKKALAKLYNEVKNSSNKDIRDYVNKNPL